MIHGGIRMIQKYVFGTPFETEAVVKDIPAVNGDPAYGCIAKIKYMAWEKPTEASTKEASGTSATVRTILNIQRTQYPCMAPTIF